MLSDTMRRRSQLIKRLQDFDYRHDLDDEANTQGIALQLRAMRADRGWNQIEVASKSGMKQSRISELENPDYGSYSLATLRRLARIFDVSLRVRFEPVSSLVDHQTGLSPSDLAVPDFAHDERLEYSPLDAARETVAANAIQSPVASGDEEFVENVLVQLEDYRHVTVTPPYMESASTRSDAATAAGG